MKYLLGSLGRAVRSQPACPGVSNRHWFGASIIATLLNEIFHLSLESLFHELFIRTFRPYLGIKYRRKLIRKDRVTGITFAMTLDFVWPCRTYLPVSFRPSLPSSLTCIHNLSFSSRSTV